jgi:hypothetical protein
VSASSPAAKSTSTSVSASSPAAKSSSPAAKSSSSNANPGSPAGSSGGPGSFTAPAANAEVEGWGTYKKINSIVVEVQVCAKKVSGSDAVGVEVVGYGSGGTQQGAIASVILPQNPQSEGCQQTRLLNVVHLKVYSFIGEGGSITKKSAMKSIF